MKFIKLKSLVSQYKAQRLKSLLVYHDGEHDWFQNDRHHAPPRSYGSLEVLTVDLDLPDPDYSPQSIAPGGLCLDRNVASIPGFVKEESNQHQVEATYPKYQPIHVPPVSGAGDDEVGEERTEVRRGQEHGRPDAYLPGVLVEEEHILDES